MATPWCEFCEVEMLIFIVVCARAALAMPKPRIRPAASWLNFMGKSPEWEGVRARPRSNPRLCGKYRTRHVGTFTDITCSGRPRRAAAPHEMFERLEQGLAQKRQRSGGHRARDQQFAVVQRETGHDA